MMHGSRVHGVWFAQLLRWCGARVCLWLMHLWLMCLWITSCGNPGSESAPSADGKGVVYKDVVGSIAPQAGSQEDMAGWLVVLVERDTQVARVGEVDSAGLYTILQVPMETPLALGLLSPTYVFQSVFASPTPTGGFVQPYVQLNASQLPKMICKGQLLVFQEWNGIILDTKSLALDRDNDGIPDGMSAFLDLVTPIDTDSDGSPNMKDTDIDNDGLLNVFDFDDDNDGLLDVVDQDSDGDLVQDALTPQGDLYFREGVQWIAVKLVLELDAKGLVTRSLTFAAKLWGEDTPEGSLQPKTVQVRGPSSLLTAATVIAPRDHPPDAPDEVWDGTLLDDGKSEDGAAGDGVYGRRILLAAHKEPVPSQVVMIQLSYPKEAGGGEVYKEFPYMFSAVSYASWKSDFVAAKRTVSVSGNPWGQEIKDYTWNVSIYLNRGADEISQQVYVSPNISASEKTFDIPDHVFSLGQTYEYRVCAQTLDRIPGYSAYMVKTPVISVGVVHPSS